MDPEEFGQAQTEVHNYIMANKNPVMFFFEFLGIEGDVEVNLITGRTTVIQQDNCIFDTNGTPMAVKLPDGECINWASVVTFREAR